HHGCEAVARIGRRFDGASTPATVTLLSPCAFRSSVGRAAAHAKAGGSVVFLGLDPDADLRVVYSMPCSGTTGPLGRIISRVGDAALAVFASQAAAGEAAAAIERVRLHVDLPETVIINAAWDPITEISVVFCEVDAASFGELRPTVELALEWLMVTLGVEEIIRAVTPQRSERGGGP